MKKISKPVLIKKLIKENDRLYQEIGRQTYNKCFFGCNSYSCLHHFILKSQSLNTRYNIKNGIPICVKHHCSIHMGQNSELEGKIVLKLGEKWFKDLMKRKHIIITNKLDFLQKENIRLKKLLN